MLRATLRQNVVAEALSGLWVKDAVTLEHAVCVSVEHFCPFVAVVTGSIAACHDVRELHRHAGVGQLLTQYGFLPSLFLEGNDVSIKSLPLGVVGHVEQSEADLTQAGRGRHEVPALDNALDEFVR